MRSGAVGMTATPLPMRSTRRRLRPAYSATSKGFKFVMACRLSCALAARSSAAPGGGKAIGRADIVPFAVVNFRGDATFAHRRAQQRRELCARAGRHIPEQLRTIKADAGESPSGRTMVAGMHVFQGKVALGMMGRIGHEYQMRQMGPEEMAGKSCEVEVAEDIAVDECKGR